MSLEDLPESAATAWSDPVERPDTHLERHDQSAYIIGLIEHLPAVYRAILTMFHLQEMSYKEIAEIVNMPEGTIKSYLFRARKLLKERLIAAEEGVPS